MSAPKDIAVILDTSKSMAQDSCSVVQRFIDPIKDTKPIDRDLDDLKKFNFF